MVIEKPYLAVGKDYYIQLRMTELAMCKDIRYIYYCEELFVVKHKSKHSCASAIFYNLGSGVVTENCKFHYMYNATVPPSHFGQRQGSVTGKLLWTKIIEMRFTEWWLG